MAKKQRKSGLLSKGHRQPISTSSSNEKKAPLSMKPLRARQLIRRFHVLLKNKKLILSKLPEKFNDLTYPEQIRKNKKFNKIYTNAKSKIVQELKINKTPKLEANEIKLESLDDDGLILKLAEIDGEIEKRGGLETYQIASTLGQNGNRGGDSSKILIKWLAELNIWQDKDKDKDKDKDAGKDNNKNDNSKKGRTALEIGCLSSKNCISTSGLFENIIRIDLKSQEVGIIQEQDFLKRPKPKSAKEKFDCISCSLVVNFVPSAEQRGEMLLRICDFLKQPVNDNKSLFFFVLPLPCIENSRYCNFEIIKDIMKNLGFDCLRQHKSHKLVYWLFNWKGEKYVNKDFKLRKREVRKGNDRNNFCIIIT